MSAIVIRAVAALSLVLVGVPAGAVPVLKEVSASFAQASNSSMIGGLVIKAETDLAILTIGGGFTIECDNSSLKQHSERHQTFNSFFGPDEVFPVPLAGLGSYAIPHWSSIPAATCGNVECLMQYKAEIRDDTSLSIQVSRTGAGAGIQLIPSGSASVGNPILIEICRSGQPVCCTPGCSLQ